MAVLLVASPAPFLAQQTDFLPVELGNRWVYEVLGENVNFIGDTRIDTVAFQFNEENLRTVAGVSFFDFPFILYPLGDFRKDDEGNLWLRLEELSPWGGSPPDVQLEEGWSRLAEFQIERLHTGNELLLYDFGSQPGSSDPDYLEWRDQLLHGQLGLSVERIDCSLYELCNTIPIFESEVKRVIFGAGGVIEESGIIAFEDGVGVTFLSREGVLTPYKWTTRLLWARIGGLEFGDYPTLVADAAWAGIKSRHAAAAVRWRASDHKRPAGRHR